MGAAICGWWTGWLAAALVTGCTPRHSGQAPHGDARGYGRRAPGGPPTACRAVRLAAPSCARCAAACTLQRGQPPTSPSTSHMAAPICTCSGPRHPAHQAAPPPVPAAVVQVQATSKPPQTTHVGGCCRSAAPRTRAPPRKPPAKTRITWKARVKLQPFTISHSWPSVLSHRRAAVRLTSQRLASRPCLETHTAAYTDSPMRCCGRPSPWTRAASREVTATACRNDRTPEPSLILPSAEDTARAHTVAWTRARPPGPQPPARTHERAPAAAAATTRQRGAPRTCRSTPSPPKSHAGAQAPPPIVRVRSRLSTPSSSPVGEQTCPGYSANGAT